LSYKKLELDCAVADGGRWKLRPGFREKSEPFMRLVYLIELLEALFA
jgi:hypothetical protein